MSGNPLRGNPLQGSAEWLAERTGSLTGSRMADALDVRKDGRAGSRRAALVKALAAERMTGQARHVHVSAAMRYGTEREPDARARYELETGRIVTAVGFVRHPSIRWCGASPDGLVGDDGLIEIKCPESSTHLEYVAAGEVPEQYRPQMLLQLACTGRAWCDFVSFDDRIRDHARQLFVRRYTPSADDIAGIEEAATALLAEVDAFIQSLLTVEMHA